VRLAPGNYKVSIEHDERGALDGAQLVRVDVEGEPRESGMLSPRCRVESAVLDGEAILLRPDHSFNFEALRSRQGQAEAILVAYDLEMDGQDVRPEALEERRKRLAKLLSRKNRVIASLS
jgi:hypothetical protein